jgi:hypothetical protein
VEKFLTTATLTIRECGFDEFWLRDQIYGDPSIMGLGDLEALSKERTQSKGGRLDLLLKDPDDNSMFEVELQLGDTDEAESFRHFLLLPSPHSTPSLRSVAQGRLRLFTMDASRRILESG